MNTDEVEGKRFSHSLWYSSNRKIGSKGCGSLNVVNNNEIHSVVIYFEELNNKLIGWKSENEKHLVGNLLVHLLNQLDCVLIDEFICFRDASVYS